MANFDHLSNLIARMNREAGIVGSSIAVYKSGKCLYEAYDGYADLETKKPVAPDTLFRIYSMTKVVAVTAALMLFERGYFRLNDEVGQYLPYLKNPQVLKGDGRGNFSVEPAQNALTFRHLFSMSSGIISGNTGSECGKRYLDAINAFKEVNGMHTLSQYAQIIGNLPLAFEPGTHFRYGSSLDVLSAVVEKLSGKTLGQFFKDEIFDPLGMKDTFFRFPSPEHADRLCSMYRTTENGLVKVTDMDANYQPDAVFEAASGGLISSLSDFSKFAQALACGQYNGVKILGRKTIDLMARNQLCPEALLEFRRGLSSMPDGTSHLEGYGYGLGVRTLMDPVAAGSNSSVGEFGWYGMAGSLLLVDPKEELSAVYMMQLLPCQENYTHNRLRNAIYAAL